MYQVNLQVRTTTTYILTSTFLASINYQKCRFDESPSNLGNSMDLIVNVHIIDCKLSLQFYHQHLHDIVFVEIASFYMQSQSVCSVQRFLKHNLQYKNHKHRRWIMLNQYLILRLVLCRYQHIPSLLTFCLGRNPFKMPPKTTRFCFSL